jgi:hypothetical protein
MDSVIQKGISVEWKSGKPSGQVRVSDGRLIGMDAVTGRGGVRGDQFSCTEGAPFRVKLRLEGVSRRYSTNPTIVSISTGDHAFSFLMRDVDLHFPIFIPEYDVVVTSADDERSFAQIESEIVECGGRTRLQKIGEEPEESFEAAAQHVRRMGCHTWLGVSRNMRIFALGEKIEWIEPRLHYFQALLPENDRKPFRYEFVMGRGWGVCDNLERRLEDEVLPILGGKMVDGEIEYNLTTFVTLETGTLSPQTLRGTDYLLADGHAKQHMFTPAQQDRFDSLLPAELESGEEVVLFLRISATNTFSSPRYAFLRTIWPSKGLGEGSALEWHFDGETGFAGYDSGRVFSISKLDGKPLEQEEVVILLQPGETTVLDVFLPHRPISLERAQELSKASFQQRHGECRTFWNSRLQQGASRIETPESRINQMIQAGLLHLDLVTYGREPDGSLAATIGDYPPIGSETAPIVQFMDSMGWHDTAKRSLNFFLEKQHDDGFIQNFNNFQLETGAALWSIGDHYRYTHDDAWIREIAPKVRKSCEFLLRGRKRNQREDLRGKGYGMLEGKTADPEDPFRSFMFNGYVYLGLSRMGEIFESLGLPEGAGWKAEAEGLKSDIRDAFFTALASSPVVPLGDGRWCPTCPPWVESRGPLALHIDGSAWHTHGSMVTRDSLLGPLYLVYQEVLEPHEPSVAFLLDFHSELMTDRNVVFSQPYYSRHPWIHLMRGETKAFLKAYYNTMASLADRETYTFWEHYFRASAHKTHEEAWFLMETRWMLYMEQGQTLHLLAGIPRSYMEDGKRIALTKVASYFGPLSLTVDSRLGQGHIDAVVECASAWRPERVELRIPHPAGIKAKKVEGGAYDAETERIVLEPFRGSAEVTVHF